MQPDVERTAMILVLLNLAVRSIESTVNQLDRVTGNRILATNALLRELHDALVRWKQGIGKCVTSNTLDSDAFDQGYKAGWSDALTHDDQKQEPLAWAIVDRQREKVRFDTFKPQRIAAGETIIPLFARPNFESEQGAE